MLSTLLIHALLSPYIVNVDGKFRTETHDKILQNLEGDTLIIYMMMMVACNTHNLFHPNELEEGGQPTINHNYGSY
jgi:hypothetical protein